MYVSTCRSEQFNTVYCWWCTSFSHMKDFHENHIVPLAGVKNKICVASLVTVSLLYAHYNQPADVQSSHIVPKPHILRRKWQKYVLVLGYHNVDGGKQEVTDWVHDLIHQNQQYWSWGLHYLLREEAIVRIGEDTMHQGKGCVLVKISYETFFLIGCDWAKWECSGFEWTGMVRVMILV